MKITPYLDGKGYKDDGYDDKTIRLQRPVLKAEHILKTKWKHRIKNGNH